MIRDRLLRTPSPPLREGWGKVGGGWFTIVGHRGNTPPRPTLSPPKGRRGNASASVIHTMATALLLIILALPLAGCGKKGAPVAPSDEPDVFPRSYPRE